MKKVPIEIWNIIAEHCDKNTLINLWTVFPALKESFFPALFYTAVIRAEKPHSDIHSEGIKRRYSQFGIEYLPRIRHVSREEPRRIPGYEQGIDYQEIFPHVRVLDLDLYPGRNFDPEKFWGEIMDMVSYMTSLRLFEYKGQTTMYPQDKGLWSMLEKLEQVPKDLTIDEPLYRIELPSLLNVSRLVLKDFTGFMEDRLENVKMQLKRILSRNPAHLRELKVRAASTRSVLDIAAICELVEPLKGTLKRLDLEHIQLVHETGRHWQLPPSLETLSFMDNPTLMNSPTLEFSNLKELTVMIDERACVAAASFPRLECLRLQSMRSYGNLSTSSIEALFRQVPNITRLVLHEFGPADVFNILAVTGSLKFLHTLEVEDARYGRSPYPTDVEKELKEVPVRTQITSLYIGSSGLIGIGNKYERFWLGLYFDLFPKLVNFYTKFGSSSELYEEVELSTSGYPTWSRLNRVAAHRLYPNFIPAPF
ncbi:hypothetical protein TRVA0_039S00848 [Trichomonascus vanleenenianus]|uniref:uncharacterized protein n=1 Tax=Trichomonascus vanleenenianus TaxID=2268995 RepID=UPI003ECB90CF